MTTAWVGIDVSKASLDAWLLPSEGRERHRKFGNGPQGWTELTEWLGESSHGVHFVMESTGPYSLGIASYLAERKDLVSVENPRYVKRWAEGMRYQNKTDRSDARVLARYARTVSPPLWALCDPDLRKIELLLRRLTDLDKMILAERNRKEDKALPDSVRESIDQVVAAIQAVRESVLKSLEAKIQASSQRMAMVEALVREPGIGVLTALRMLSHFQWDPSRFKSAQQAAAAAGYNPVRKESGTFKGATRISKCGPAEFRGNLHMAAVVAIQFNPRIKAFYEKLLAKGLSKLAALTACARKLLMIAFGILKAHLKGKEPIYSADKERFSNLRGKQRAIPKKGQPLTI